MFEQLKLAMDVFKENEIGQRIRSFGSLKSLMSVVYYFYRRYTLDLEI